MKFLTYFLIFFFSLGQVGRLVIPDLNFPVQINDAVVGSLVFFFVINRKNWKELINDWLTKPLLIWIVAMALSLVFNFSRIGTEKTLISATYALRFVIYSGLYYLAKKMFKAAPQNFNLWHWAFVFISVLGFTQYLFLPSLYYLRDAGWDDHFNRLVSTFFDPGFAGAMLSLGLVFAFLSDQKRIVKYTSLSTLYIALALTYSRASYAMFLSSFALISIRLKKPLIFIACLLLLLLTVNILPKTRGEGTKLGREYSIWSRVENWKQSVEVWATSPIFGVGFNAYRYSLPALDVNISQNYITSHGGGADSSLMLVLATTGIVGLLAYLNLFTRILINQRRNLLFLASFVGLFVHSWFNNTLFYPWGMEWIFLLLAISQK